MIVKYSFCRITFSSSQQDQDDDDDNWGQDVYTRQGLLQDMGVFDIILQMVAGPIDGFDPRTLRKDDFVEFNDLWVAALKTIHNGAKGEYTKTDKVGYF